MISKRENQVIDMVLNGYTNKEIGNLFHIKESTVKFHLTSIFKKMEVKNRNQLFVKLMMRK